MSRIRLEIEESFDFRIIGISCHEKDYRLAWALNQAGEFQLERKEDLMPDGNGTDEKTAYPFYEDVDEDQYKTYQLLANRFGSNLFLPELATIDYLFFVRGDADDLEMEKTLERIHRVSFVILASELEIDKIKQKENLLFF